MSTDLVLNDAINEEENDAVDELDEAVDEENNNAINEDKEKELYNKKYNVLLKLLNEILKHNQKDKYVEIKNIEDFQKIDGRHLRNKSIDEVRKRMDKDIVSVFKRKDIRYNQKTDREFYTFCCIKFMCKNIGYEFKRVSRKNGVEKRGEDGYKLTTILFYSIVKK
jgi:hypothetical protein